MSAATARHASDDPNERLIGHCYTKARRLPVVVGKIPGGNARLPGGPYTKTQLAALVGLFIPLVATRSLWGTHTVLDLLIVVVVPYTGAWALRFVRLDGRNPAAVLLSITMLAAAPRHGRLRGRPWRAVGAHRARAACTLPPDDSSPAAEPPLEKTSDLEPFASDTGGPQPPGLTAPAPAAAARRTDVRPPTADKARPADREEPVPPRPATRPIPGRPQAAGDDGTRSRVQLLLAQHRATAPEKEPTKGH
ncbi:hypothetical protein AB0H07_40520 [Streptomyces sp. NPDC021354]|uniref:hypothetical protein n=1 Tax=Streptomyces sp. NPDC021354 TaxID=3154793 RepID=UPI0033FF9AA9